MNKKYECGIILDLLPLSIENMVSRETEQIIKQHLSECEDCKQVYEEMNRDIDITAEKAKRKKRRKHKYKKKNIARMWICGYLLILLLIIAFCLIDMSFF